MKILATPKITYKQTEILRLLYAHRFLTRIQIQALLKHKDKKTINLWLRDLRAKEYINWIYNKDHFAEKTKPAIYYLGINGLRRFQSMPYPNHEEIRKRYKEHQRSQGFIDRCLLLADCRIRLENFAEDNSRTHIHTNYYCETEADYSSDSYYHFLSDSELIRPQLCFAKLEHDGIDDPHAIESYLLEVFDSTLPRYRLKYRLKQYVTYLDEEMNEWDQETYGDPKPIILLVCASTTDLIYAKRRTRGLIDDIWERDDEDRPHVRFTTTEKLQEHGVLEEIWEKA